MIRAALVHVACLSADGPRALAPLYRLLDAAADLLARVLRLRYRRVLRLRGRAATREALLAAVAAAAADPGVEAVDLVVHAHGLERLLVLADGGVSTAALGAALGAALRGEGKLRLLYSTACHAASHAADLRAAGFRAVVGAEAVNASGATEVPLCFGLWLAGWPLGRVLALADHPLPRRCWDALARPVLRAAGAPARVDSRKRLEGDPALTFATAPGRERDAAAARRAVSG